MSSVSNNPVNNTSATFITKTSSSNTPEKSSVIITKITRKTDDAKARADIEAFIRPDNRSIHDRNITPTQQYKPFPKELTVALCENNLKQVRDIIISPDFNIYNQEAIIKIMTILVEINNIEMLDFLQNNLGLNIKQVKKVNGLPTFYCVFYAIAKVATEENLPEIEKMINKLFKFGFLPLSAIDRRDFLSVCSKEYSNYNEDNSLYEKVSILLTQPPRKITGNTCCNII